MKGRGAERDRLVEDCIGRYLDRWYQATIPNLSPHNWKGLASSQGQIRKGTSNNTKPQPSQLERIRQCARPVAARLRILANEYIAAFRQWSQKRWETFGKAMQDFPHSKIEVPMESCAYAAGLPRLQSGMA